jgi:hypothetical protein
MSGVIDDRGVQWEHCSLCHKFVRLTNLGYVPPHIHPPYGQDICMECTNMHPQIESIIPAKSWIAEREGAPA